MGIFCLTGWLVGCGGGADPVVPKLPGPNTTIHGFTVTGTSAPDLNGVVPIVLVADKASFQLNWEATAATVGYTVYLYLSADEKVDYDHLKPASSSLDAWVMSVSCGLQGNTCGRTGVQDCRLDLSAALPFDFVSCAANDPNGQHYDRFLGATSGPFPKKLFLVTEVCDIVPGQEDCKFKAVPVLVTR